VLSASRPAFAALAAASAVLLSATACTGLDEANAASITRDDPISELATQLAGGAGLTYTATYQLAGGETATITQAQKPARTAYVYPGGRLIATTAGTIRCDGDDAPRTCTETAAAPSASPGAGALISPDAVLTMLNTAALDDDATAEQHDTTIAGRHATCLNIRKVDGTPAREFSVCVTNEGALGSFAATIKGERADVALTTYADKADARAFTVPRSARLIDKRPK
jgi:hypothetical protein